MSRYDDGDFTVRSLQKHQAWLAKLPCPVLRLDGARPVPELVQHDFTAENVVHLVGRLVDDGPGRDKMVGELAEVKRKMSGPLLDEVDPADRAAQMVLALATS